MGAFSNGTSAYEVADLGGGGEYDTPFTLPLLEYFREGCRINILGDSEVNKVHSLHTYTAYPPMSPLIFEATTTLAFTLKESLLSGVFNLYLIAPILHPQQRGKNQERIREGPIN